jgi:Tfp pilus assembly protein PilF
MNDWSNAEAHAERAHQFYEAGQWDKALVELKRALAVNPNQCEWHFGMGLTLEALGRHGEAAQSFERVLDLRGDDQETMINLALNLNRASEPVRAIKTLERVNRADPDCEKGYCLRIESYTRLGDHESAEQMFYLARQIVDECPDCYNYIAHSLMQRGQLDKALWCWHRVVRLEPYYPGVYAALARVHRRRDHHLRSQRLYLKQLRQDPGTGRVAHGNGPRHRRG